MKKKILATVLISMMFFSLTACGSKNDSTQESVAETQESTEATEVLGTEVMGTQDTEAESTEVTTESIQAQEEQDTQEQKEDQDQEKNQKEDQDTSSQEQEAETKAEESQKETYTYEDLSVTMYAKSSVNVRDLPCKDGKKLGKLGQYDKVTVTGKCNETGWYCIQYNEGTAYVSGSYLITESEKKAAEQKAKEEAEKAAKAEAEKKAQESSKTEETSKTDESNKKTEQTTDTKKEESSKKEETQKQESQKKEPEWIMWESASNKYLTDAQKKHIDEMVKKWLNDDSYTDMQLHTDLADYLMSIGINVGFGNPEPCVDSFGIHKYSPITLNKKKQGQLNLYKQDVREEARVYEFRAFYTKWEYYDDGSLIVYDCSVGIS